MIRIKLNFLPLFDVDSEFVFNDFLIWMNENIGIRGKDWEWLSADVCDISVCVKDPEFATLIALRWK